MLLYITNNRFVSVKSARVQHDTGGRDGIPKGWLHDSCGFCVYFVANTSRMLLRSST